MAVKRRYLLLESESRTTYARSSRLRGYTDCVRGVLIDLFDDEIRSLTTERALWTLNFFSYRSGRRCYTRVPDELQLSNRDYQKRAIRSA